jgi:dCTP deaminase
MIDVRDWFRPVLSDKSIMKYNEKHLLIEQPIKEEQLQPNSVDLTLGNTWKKIKPNSHLFVRDSIDPRIPIEYESGLFEDKYINGEDKSLSSTHRSWYRLMPKEFILMASNEILNIPNGILSFVQGRSSIARLAIQTEQAGLIDAGFRGTITLEVFNQSDYPIYLFSGMRIAQVYFFKAQYANKIYGSINKGSKYSNQIEATGSEIYKDPEFHSWIYQCWY